ncbi:hypothetical protein QE385_002303 [Sphingomonas sp. SORGH_AS 950]|uniref:hypothetical protein n=1 Tax=Sphingomonas sp. SORGH_AS_0950 TaxID=3041792 RepID=UPI002786FF78|nr:hypothetical protein [Sphingomonas sp. SORGH_AS_0950]MDQ1157976.1 hypothetical protein [Sphingomonas sp. SORGH_AS_0950]
MNDEHQSIDEAYAAHLHLERQFKDAMATFDAEIAAKRTGHDAYRHAEGLCRQLAESAAALLAQIDDMVGKL